MARAISSFPVPVSPNIRTVESVGATFATCDSTARSAAEEPTILPILPQRSLFDFKRETACKGRPAFLPQALEILRMKDPCAKVRGDHVFHSEAGIIEHCLVRVDRRAVGVLANNGLGYGV